MEFLEVGSEVIFRILNGDKVDLSVLKIFQPIDSITEQEALKTVQVLVQTIYAVQEGHETEEADIQGLGREVCEECIEILREPEKSQAKHAIKIICAFMSTTRKYQYLSIKHRPLLTVSFPFQLPFPVTLYLKLFLTLSNFSWIEMKFQTAPRCSSSYPTSLRQPTSLR